MTPEVRKAALLKTLMEDYGIYNAEQLLEAISKMKKLDITQFVFIPMEKGAENAI